MLLQSPLPFLREMAKGFLHLGYPDLCVACSRDLPTPDLCFCLKCRLKLHPSDMHKTPDNEFSRRFWGRLPLAAGAAQYYFTRKSPIQSALHQLKYKNKPDIGLKLGRLFGRQLAQSESFRSVDMIVPVPLHPKKERLRGYNQSLMFARGLSEGWDGMPVCTDVLVRDLFTESQTRKKRMERFQNMRTVFAIRKPGLLEGKHVLLVDDVLTTGATLEMCGQALLEAAGVQLSMATIAIAMRE